MGTKNGERTSREKAGQKRGRDSTRQEMKGAGASDRETDRLARCTFAWLDKAGDTQAFSIVVRENDCFVRFKRLCAPRAIRKEGEVGREKMSMCV